MTAFQYGTLDQPSRPRSWAKTALTWAIYIALVTTAALIITGIYIVVKLSTGSHITNVNATTFSLYKNTRFTECAYNSTADVDCARAFSSLDGAKHGWYTRVSHTSQLRVTDVGSPSWCEWSSCFADFKVIPSHPLQGVYGYSVPIHWIELMMTVLAGLWASRSMFCDQVCRDRCKGIGIKDYASGAFTVSMAGFWFYSFVAMALNPKDHTPVSIYGFGSTWTFAVLLNCHPYICKWKTDRGKGLMLVRAVIAIAFVQWVLTCYVVHVKKFDIFGGGVNRDENYVCLEQEIATAPGTSVCTAQELCSLKWMFTQENLGSSSLSLVPMKWSTAVAFSALMTTIFVSTAVSIYLYRRFFDFDFEEETWRFYVTFTLPYALIFAIMLWYSVFVVREALLPEHLLDREGPVAFDMNCRAVHVLVSSWRFFLDIDDGGKALRIVRAWFNS